MDGEKGTDLSVNQPPEGKKTRKPRGASKMIMGTEMTVEELLVQLGFCMPPNSNVKADTRLVLIAGRVSTPKAGDKLAEELELTGQVVIATVRASYSAGVRQQWFKGVAKK